MVAAIDADGVTRQATRAVLYEKATPLAIKVRHRRRACPCVRRGQRRRRGRVVEPRRGRGERDAERGRGARQQRERVAKTSGRDRRADDAARGRQQRSSCPRGADGDIRQEVRTVTLDRPTAVRRGPGAATGRAEPRPATPSSSASDATRTPSIPTLRYAVADAEAMYAGAARLRRLQEGERAAADGPQHRNDRKPTLRNIKWALGTFLARCGQQGRHRHRLLRRARRARGRSPRRQSATGSPKYLMPSDADPERPVLDGAADGRSADDLRPHRGRARGDVPRRLLQRCRRRADVRRKRTRARRVDDVFLERLARSRGRAIVTASRAAEVSIELPELGHGLFTHYLLQGLRTAAISTATGSSPCRSCIRTWSNR